MDFHLGGYSPIKARDRELGRSLTKCFKMARQTTAETKCTSQKPNGTPERNTSNGSRSMSALSLIDKIYESIRDAKHNKAHVEKFRSTTEMIVKALNGMDVNFIRGAEFYSDMKETLYKILYHITEASNRNKWLKYMMAKKDEMTFVEIQKHADNLVSRIIFSYAQRTKEKRRRSPSPSSEGRCYHADSACGCSDVSMES